MNSDASYRVRQTHLADFFLLRRWANDRVTRENALNTQRISFVAHLSWFFKNAKNPDYFRFVVEGCPPKGGAYIPMMFVGFRRSDVGVYEVSVNLAPNYRGLGLSHDLLESAIVKLGSLIDEVPVLRATIRSKNLPSRRLFRNLGFEEVASGDTLVIMEKS